MPIYEYYVMHYFRAATLAELGRLDEGRKHLAEAIRLRPQLSAKDSGAFHPYRPDLTAKFVDALRKVGLPEVMTRGLYHPECHAPTRSGHPGQHAPSPASLGRPVKPGDDSYGVGLVEVR
ncbi:MAG: hypothetical protein EXQ94_03195 [Alphaproteobacteria bacterium]|nr:hypothetical protein [Alphaproteobacteria bacterium]